MYKSLIFVNGCFLTLMFLLNKLLSQELGLYRGILVFHFIGLLVILLIIIYKKVKLFNNSKFKFYYVFPGLFSLIMTIINNISIPQLGISIVTSLGLFGQLICSIVFEKYGILGVVKKEFRKEKLIGFMFLFIGIILMALY